MSTCNCRKDIEAKLLERFKLSAPDASDHGVELQGYALVIETAGLFSKPVMPYKTSAIYPLKKGGTKLKSVTGNMILNYCPFCGASLEGESA